MERILCFISMVHINEHFQTNCQLIHNDAGPTEVMIRATTINFSNRTLILLTVNNANDHLNTISFLHPSIGVSALDMQDSSIEMAINRADHALYQAKQNGRNRVEIALLPTT